MAPLVLSPRSRFNSSKSSRSLRPQHLLAYGAAAFVLMLLVSWLRSGSSHHQQQASAGRKHYGLAGSTPKAAAADHQQLEQQYQQWLSTFRAADASYQDYCMAGGTVTCVRVLHAHSQHGLLVRLLTCDALQHPTDVDRLRPAVLSCVPLHNTVREQSCTTAHGSRTRGARPTRTSSSFKTCSGTGP